MSKRVAILGLGWLGEPLAHSLFEEGYAVSGSTTSLEKVQRLSTNPFYVGQLKINADSIEGNLTALFFKAEVVIINFPPKRLQGIEEIFLAQINQLLPYLVKGVKVIFISSTSVYSNVNSWVKEEDELPLPQKASGRALIKAEQMLHQHCGDDLTILRLAGLIGPGRHPGNFLANKRKLKNANVPVNLIHLDDVIGIIKTVLKQNVFGTIINCCANDHPIRKEFYTKAAEQLNLPAPVFVNDNTINYKLVSNQRSKEVLGYRYEFNSPLDIIDKKTKGKITIAGAGPGNIDLLTIAAQQALINAEVILHDNLVSEDILNINKQAEKVYVGRKYGDKSNQSDRQLRINLLLEKYFSEGKKVVRLKSGDPYVYGRAAEEVRYLVKQSLPFEVIPGISAALAAANNCNIPITERHKSNAVLICTAHTADYSFEQLKGIAGLLKAGNTLALYMGLKSLDKLIPKLIEVCKDGTIPVNAVSNVSRSNQAMITSTLENIRTDLERNPIAMPVVFLIGINPIN